MTFSGLVQWFDFVNVDWSLVIFISDVLFIFFQYFYFLFFTVIPLTIILLVITIAIGFSVWWFFIKQHSCERHCESSKHHVSMQCAGLINKCCLPNAIHLLWYRFGEPLWLQRDCEDSHCKSPSPLPPIFFQHSPSLTLFAPYFQYSNGTLIFVIQT